MVNTDVRTRVELKNETQRIKPQKGMAGNVALIGAFPSSRQKVFAAESFAQLVHYYGVKLNSNAVYWYGGVRAARRIFMEGINGYGGANSVTCVNICNLTPDKFSDVYQLYQDTYDETLNIYNTDSSQVTTNVNINALDKYTPTDSIIAKDTALTFEKLKKALRQIADEDMDLLFIAHDLNEIFKNPITNYEETHFYTRDIPTDVDWTLKTEKTSNKGERYGAIVFNTVTNEPVFVGSESTRLKAPYNVYDKYADLQRNTYLCVNARGKTANNMPVADIEKLRYEEYDAEGHVTLTKDFVKTTEGNETVYKYTNPSDSSDTKTLKIGTSVFAPGAELPLGENEIKKTVVFMNSYINGKYTATLPLTDGTYADAPLVPVLNKTTGEIEEKVFLNYNNYHLFKFMVYAGNVPQKDKDTGEIIYGETDNGKYIKNLGDVYDFILDFIDNEFTNHRPISYVGAVTTQGLPEGALSDMSIKGVPSNYIKIYSSLKYNMDDAEYAVNEAKYNGDGNNPYWNIGEWGALDIAKLFTRNTNELSTCGLFYQTGIINKEEVDPIELAAHICGWICSVPISQDLTYQTIPGLTDINEEPFFGEYDAGKLLNEAGIQVIRPKSRLNKTFYVNNSVMPTGWHTNHVRSVIYLLKQLQFETGLGMNNYVTNTEAFRALLDAAAKSVMDDCEVIRSVDIGKVEVLSHYHIYVPISIVLSGVVTLIEIGVSMALDETGTWGTYVKTTSGYSVDA